MKILFNANRSQASLQLLSALLFISYSLNSHAQADTYESEKPYNIQWETDITNYSPTQSIDSFTDDWDEPLENGDFAYIQGRSNIRYSTDQSPLSYALNYRYDYLLSFIFYLLILRLLKSIGIIKITNYRQKTVVIH